MNMKKMLALVLALVMMLSIVACVPADNTTAGKTPNATTGGNNSTGGQTVPVGYVDDGKTYTYRMAPADLPDAWNLHTYQSNSATYVLNYTGDSLYTYDYNDDFTGFQIVPAMAADYPVDVTAEYVGKYGIKEGDVNKAYKITLKDYLTFDNGEPLNAHSFEASMKLLLDPRAANFRADNVYQASQLKIVGAEGYVKGGSYALSQFVSENYGDEEYINPADFTVTAEGTLQVNGKDIVLDVNSGGNWGSSGIVGYFSEYIYNEDGSWLGLMDLATGEQVAWRTVSKQDVDGESKYLFFDLEGNPVEIGLNDDKTAYVWEGMTIDFATEVTDPTALALVAAADEDGRVVLTAETLKLLQDAIAILHGYENVEAYAADAGDYAYMEFEEMAFLGQYFDAIEYEGNVGFFAASDNELVVVMVNPMEDNFYLRKELSTSFFLVYAPLYEACITIDENGVYSNSYGTSIDTFVGYGPYKLETYVEGAEINLVRNELWRGYNAAEYVEGTYQTDAVHYTKITDEATRLEMFLQGKLESYGLRAEDMEDYLGSEYTYFNDSESTWYLAMNPDFENLSKIQETTAPVNPNYSVNKTVLTIPEFRQALSYSIDRTEFNLLLSPTSGVAKALLSSFIVADPEVGLTYRAMDQAKDAILEFWGLADAWGEGKEYATRDEAIESITGYDPAGAKTLFDQAYDKAVADGLLTAEQIESGNWEVQICVGKPAEASYYTKGYEFLSTCWTNAVKGTKFEGHLTFTLSQTLGSTTFGTYLRTGAVDMLFGVGYGGDEFDPYSMLECFTGSLQYDPFTDKKEVMLDVELNGKTLRASLYAWVSECLMGKEIEADVVGADGNVTGEKVKIKAGVSDDAAVRVEILAKAETKILTLSNVFPLQTDASASMRCMRYVYKTEEYVTGMGRGGIQYSTYLMDDAEFAAYVAAQGGKLNYK